MQLADVNVRNKDLAKDPNSVDKDMMIRIETEIEKEEGTADSEIGDPAQRTESKESITETVNRETEKIEIISSPRSIKKNIRKTDRDQKKCNKSTEIKRNE